MSAFWKDIFREIKNTFGRFISLFIIIGLGTASIVGIQATTIDMRDIADKYYKQASLYDIQVKSTTGFDEDDIKALSDAGGVSVVMPTYVYDVFIYSDNEARTARTYALPDSLNQVELIEGRLPTNATECVVEADVLSYAECSIGDMLHIGRDDMEDFNSVISNDTFTIVGVVRSPFYITHERGNTTIGDGALKYYLYLTPDAYKLDVYTDIYLSMSGSREMDNLTDKYYEYLDEWKSQVETVGDVRVEVYRQKLYDAQIEIDDGFIEYYDGVKEFEEKISDAKKELSEAKIELEDAKIKLEDGQIELDAKIADAQKEIDKNAAELKDGQRLLNTKRKELQSGREQFEEGILQLNSAQEQLEAIAPRGASEELDAQYAQLDAKLAEMQFMQNELDSGQAAIESSQRKLDDGERKIEDARAELKTEQEKAQKEIDDGWVEYYDGVDKYNSGIEELETEEADALAELADARAELEDAQNKLDDAPTPEWFVFTREDGVSYDSYYQDTQRLEKIGYVFPLVFFLVAIMVSLTSMSRMVEERRTQIGLYKALGYRPAAIMLKYLTYSALASAGGGIVGVNIGSVLFPRVISDAYGFLYEMPPVETPVPLVLSTVAILLAMGSLIAVTLLTCASSLRESPSLLMRPKPPAAGKRVLLERIPFIWKRLSFIGKVTARNIFRYKRRFFMTLAGIAGCTALLVTGFGLRDSVAGVAEMQYNTIVLYDTTVYIKEITDSKQRGGLDKIFDDRHLYIREETTHAEGPEGGLSARIVVPEKPEELSNYVNMSVPLTNNSNGVLITKKLARVMGVSVGESFTMLSGEGKTYSAVVSGIVENYIMHYIYMPPAVYTDTFEEPLYSNGVWAFSTDKQSLASKLLEDNNVRAVVHNSDMLTRMSEATDVLGIVTIVLIALACALALIVLFNLTNINISERIRELATIKVLGFYNGEMSMYVYRENAAVTALGIAAGMLGGIFLHRFVLMSAEIDMLMFPLIIQPLSYLYSIILSAAFAVFVNLVMNIKLSRIDMVESLKNVE